MIHLYYYEGYSVKEISVILKISEAAVKQRLKRARTKLKIELEAES
ncbi:MAG: RNA polymerase sigma factor [Thomasclavelia ramosa]